MAEKEPTRTATADGGSVAVSAGAGVMSSDALTTGQPTEELRELFRVATEKLRAEEAILRNLKEEIADRANELLNAEIKSAGPSNDKCARFLEESGADDLFEVCKELQELLGDIGQT